MAAAFTKKEEVSLANQAEVYQREITFEGGIVLCPVYGGDYLHQGAVEVWNREFGANTDGVRITKSGETTSPLADNPSRERRGLVIESECEDCGDFGGLVVSQDAGHTSISWNCDRVKPFPPF